MDGLSNPTNEAAEKELRVIEVAQSQATTPQNNLSPSPKSDQSDQVTINEKRSGDYEKERELRHANPNGLTRTRSGVDVEQAERDFAIRTSQRIVRVSGTERAVLV